MSLGDKVRSSRELYWRLLTRLPLDSDDECLFFLLFLWWSSEVLRLADFGFVNVFTVFAMDCNLEMRASKSSPNRRNSDAGTSN